MFTQNTAWSSYLLHYIHANLSYNLNPADNASMLKQTLSQKQGYNAEIHRRLLVVIIKRVMYILSQMGLLPRSS